MKITRLLIAAGMLLLSASLFADGLVKFKAWDASPQGYFMTKAEHEQWAMIRTDDEAQRFVDSFLAKRGPAFAAEVASRAEQADRNLTIGKKPGSVTLRGKLVILLGPPSPFDVSEAADKSHVHHDSPMMATALSGGTGIDATGDFSYGNEGASKMGSSTVILNYHFTYASTIAGPLEVTISADPNTGKDRAKDRSADKQLDAAFEAAAQASIKNK